MHSRLVDPAFELSATEARISAEDVGSGKRVTLAKLYGTSRDIEVYGTLFAAAPGLLGALKALIEEIKAHHSPERDEEGALSVAAVRAIDTIRRATASAVTDYGDLIGDEYACGWDAAVAACAAVIKNQDRTGREWVTGSLWDAIYKRFAPDILALSGKGSKA